MQQLIRINLRKEIQYIDGMRGLCIAEPLYVTPYAYDNLLGTEELCGMRLHDGRPADGPFPMWDGKPSHTDILRDVAFTHEGGMGDELIWSAHLWQLRYKYPNLRFTNYTQGANAYMAEGAMGVTTLPSPFGFREREIFAYDWLIFPRPLTYEQRGTEANAYDLNATEIGVDDLRFHQPSVIIPEEEVEGIRELLKQLPEQFWQNMILIQLSSNENIRTPDHWGQRLSALVASVDSAFPNRFFFVIVGTSAECNLAQIRSGLTAHPRVITAPYGMATSLSPRTMLYFAKVAKVVISPDSMLMHASAAFETPCIALWNEGNGGSVADNPNTPDPLRLPLTRARHRARERNPYLSHVQRYPEQKVPPPCSRIRTYPFVTVIGMEEHPQFAADWLVDTLKETVHL